MGADEISTPEITVTDAKAPTNDLQVPFGPVALNSTAEQTLTVTNVGSVNLDISSVGQADPFVAPFYISADNCSGMSLTPAASCTVTVRFLPTATGSFSDSFDILSNDPDENQVVANLNGSGEDDHDGGGGGGCLISALIYR